MKKAFRVLLAVIIAIQLVTLPPILVSAAPVITTVTDRTVWETSVGGIFREENFDDADLNPGLSFSTSIGVVTGGVWHDIVDNDPVRTTTWIFDCPITAFGGNWNLAGPGGPGKSINVYVNGSWIFIGNIPNSYSGGFWGFTCSQPFTQVRLEAGPSSGVQETYDFDNLVYSLTASMGSLTPDLAFNPVNTPHTMSVTVTPHVAGIPVVFVITGSPLVQSPVRLTNASGVATLTYVNPIAGMQRIYAFIDVNGNGFYDVGEPCSTNLATKYWLENYLTGGGQLKSESTSLWGFSGTVGVDAVEGIVGSFHITNFATKTTYKSTGFTYLNFWEGEATTPPATHRLTCFTGAYRNNRNLDIITLTVYIRDNYIEGEGEKGIDHIAIQVGERFGTGAMWIGTNVSSAITPVEVTNGNFQIHNIS